MDDLVQKEMYKYLGMEEIDGIQYGKMREKRKQECYGRVRGLLQLELNAKYKIEAIKISAIPIVTYSFNVFNWNLEEINRTDRKTRKLMTLKADVSRMYIPRKEGGRGITNLEMAYKTTTIGVNTYLQSSGDFNFQLNTAQKEIEVNTKPTKTAKDI